MATQVILLERIAKLGNMGDIVSVKPGFARNYLLPQKKGLRATKNNIAYFEGQKKVLETNNIAAKKTAEVLAKKIEGAKAALIRQASESGQLFGSVTSRDIAEAVAAETGEAVTRNMVAINRNFKTIGLFPVDIALHAEVHATVTINIARTPEEAEIQAKTGKSLVAEAEQEDAPQEAEANLEAVLEDSALEIEKDKAEAAEVKAAEDAVSAEKSEARKAKKEAKAADAPEEEAAEEETTEIGA